MFHLLRGCRPAVPPQPPPAVDRSAVLPGSSGCERSRPVSYSVTKAIAESLFALEGWDASCPCVCHSLRNCYANPGRAPCQLAARPRSGARQGIETPDSTSIAGNRRSRQTRLERGARRLRSGPGSVIHDSGPTPALTPVAVPRPAGTEPSRDPPTCGSHLQVIPSLEPSRAADPTRQLTDRAEAGTKLEVTPEGRKGGAVRHLSTSLDPSGDEAARVLLGGARGDGTPRPGLTAVAVRTRT
jgi:hypothetical protein